MVQIPLRPAPSLKVEMKSPGSQGNAIAMLFAGAFSLLVSTEIAVLAQRPARPSPVERRVDVLNRQGEEYERDKQNRDVETESEKGDRRRAEALMAQIKKDLESLQSGYNQIVLAMASKPGLGNDQILEAITEIKGCSTRLKRNLALPRPNKSKAPTTEATAEQSEEPLLSLRKHIYNFVMNPIFAGPAVLDVEEGKKASRDLDMIIELSDSITKKQDKTRKSAH
jgi:hypothetical protein